MTNSARWAIGRGTIATAKPDILLGADYDSDDSTKATAYARQLANRDDTPVVLLRRTGPDTWDPFTAIEPSDQPVDQPTDSDAEAAITDRFHRTVTGAFRHALAEQRAATTAPLEAAIERVRGLCTAAGDSPLYPEEILAALNRPTGDPARPAASGDDTVGRLLDTRRIKIDSPVLDDWTVAATDVLLDLEQAIARAQHPDDRDRAVNILHSFAGLWLTTEELEQARGTGKSAAEAATDGPQP